MPALDALRSRAGQALGRFLLAYAPDTRERHAIVGKLAGTPETVLDAGGVPGLLVPYLPRGARVVTANVEPPADLLVQGVELPVDDGSFDLVTSLDVLEHIVPADRRAFVAELVRAAKDRVVLCCPLGTPQHQAAEAELLEWYEQATGDRHEWLAEHVENGLPTDDEIRAAFATATDDAEISFLYHGDFRTSTELLKQTASAMANGPGRKAVLVAKWLGHRRDLRLETEPTAWTNRVFVKVER
jgi:SAM-dependent methyltransferase